MITRRIIKVIIYILFAAGCTTQFFPEFDENPEFLVVDALLTDQDRVNTVILSKSAPVGTTIKHDPVRGAIVTISDETGSVTALRETSPGIYNTDSTVFRGRIGGKYSLGMRIGNRTYETDITELKPVPPIDSLYYEKVTITESDYLYEVEEGCSIYLDTYDPLDECRHFRWTYTETWEYRIPYTVTNRICWVTENSDRILVKNTAVYNQPKVTKFPVTFISNETDRLKVKYSILVRQYSLDENEYEFWRKVGTVSQNTGNLYDRMPSAIRSNIRCTSHPEEQVLGYFSVSSVTEKRLFVEDEFLGLTNFVTYCATDTVFGTLPENGLNSTYWVIEDNSNDVPPWWVLTTFRECADCTTEGSKTMPSFWLEDKKK